MKRISEDLEEIINSLGINWLLLRDKVEAEVRKIIDEWALPQPESVEFNGKTLLISDPNASLRQELLMRQRALLRRLNETPGLNLIDVKIILRRRT